MRKTKKQVSKIDLLFLLKSFNIVDIKTWSIMREGLKDIPEPRASSVIDITISGLMTYFVVTPRRKRSNP